MTVRKLVFNKVFLLLVLVAGVAAAFALWQRGVRAGAERRYNRLNDQEGITIVLVTHEWDIAAHAKRLVQFLDGCVVYDGAVQDRSLERG